MRKFSSNPKIEMNNARFQSAKRSQFWVFFVFLLLGICFVFSCRRGPDAKLAKEMHDIIYVKDFGAVPDDGHCDAKALQQAIEYAAKHKIATVFLDKGRYDLKIDNIEERENMKSHIWFESIHHGLTLKGESNSEGVPVTALIRENPCNTEDLPPLITVHKSSDISLQNLRFDNDPYYNSAGKVIEKTASHVIVEILKGHPAVNGMESCLIGGYDLEKQRLRDGKISFHSAGKWELLPGDGIPHMKLSSSIVAERTHIGDGLFWFFTTNGGRQVFFDDSKDIKLKNVWSSGSSGMAYYFYRCHNIKIENLSISPDAGRIVVSPRDGLHFNLCSGVITMNNLVIDGTNDDGMNIHGEFFIVEKKFSGHNIAIKALRSYPYEIPSNSRVAFFDGAVIGHFGTIRNSLFNPDSNLHSIEFAEPLPDWINMGTECVPYAMLPDSVTISNSIFKNIATCGIIIKSDNTTVENCVFDNVERVAVFALCSFYDPTISMMEPTAANGVIIRNNSFDNCGRKLRAGGMGGLAAVATDIGRRDGASIRNVTIINNHFRNMENNCINIMDADGVEITENAFVGIPPGRQVFVDTFSKNVHIHNNQSLKHDTN
jgi:polygalacturonase